MTAVAVRLNSETPALHGADDVHIPHGHYRDAFARYPLAVPVARRAVFFGRVQPYKGLERLIATFGELRLPSVTLRIVGSAAPEYAEELRSLVAGDCRVSVDFRFVPDAELVSAVSEAQLAVLPYREMHNSGALFVALSLGTPVLAPRTASNIAIQSEVGAEWLHLYDGELTSNILAAALQWSDGPRPGSSPAFDVRRDWIEVARAYADVFQQALTRSSVV